MKVRELRRLLLDDGWQKIRQKGSHERYKHAKKPGLVTLASHGKNTDVPKGTLEAILKKAGLK